MARLSQLDILLIQTAIEEYEVAFPQRETPSAEAALAWRSEARTKRGKKRAIQWKDATTSRYSLLKKLRAWLTIS